MNELDSVSYDQYKNIPTADENGIKTKIIFSQEALLNLFTLLNNSKKSGNETGCFFMGRASENDSNAILIDYFTSDFKCADAFVQGGSAEPTDRCYNEVNAKYLEYKNKNQKPCIIHFHTHPRQLHYENFSDQDLSIYAKSAVDSPAFNVFGMLGFPIPDSESSISLSVVKPVNAQVINGRVCADFYRFPNIYYAIKNELFKIGTFEKRYEGRTFKPQQYGNIVRNAVSNSISNDVCVIGVDPNTGEKVQDESVGYIDANETYCFVNENVNLTFKKMQNREDELIR